MRIFTVFLLLISLTACGSQSAPLENDESSTTPAQEELSPLDSPTNLADAGGNLASLVTSPANLSAQGEVKSFYLTASHGGFNPNVIEVNERDTVKLTLESIDARHSFVVPALGVRAEIPARDVTTLEFIATRQGQFEFLSDVYSGAGTGTLRGVLLVK